MGTEVVWEVLKQERSPILVVVNMMDKEHADFDAAVRSCHDRLGLNAVAVQLPIGEAEDFHGIVDLIENKAWQFTGRGVDEKSQEIPVPAELKDRAAAARATLMEEAATGDESLMEKFLSTGELTVEEIRRGLCERVVMCDLAPVFCCSAFHNLGVKEVLDEVVDVLPSPLDVHPQKGTNGNGGAEIEVRPEASAPDRRDRLQDARRGPPGRALADPPVVRPPRARQGAREHVARPQSEKLGTLYHLMRQGALGLQGRRRGRHRRRREAARDAYRRHARRQGAAR